MTKEHNEEKYIILKSEPNEHLWQEISKLASGKALAKIKAVDLIIDNYREVPDEADDLLKNMANPTNYVTVRRRIAKRLAAQPGITWVLHVQLLDILSKDPDKTVNRIVSPIWKSYYQLSESIVPIKSAMSNVLEAFQKIPTQPFEEIAKKFQISIPSTTIEDIMKRISAIPVDSILDLSETLKNITLPKVPMIYSDSIINFKSSQDNQLSKALQVVPSYFPIESEYTELKTLYNPSINKLQNMPTGNEHWQEYQALCSDILTNCFVPPLIGPYQESRTDTGTHRRDIIYQIPGGITEFWGYVQIYFSAIGIVIDAKNYSQEIPSDQIVAVSKYLGEKKLGKLGIIISRKGPSKSAISQQIDTWSNYGIMVVCLSDEDLIQMITRRETNNHPEKLLDEQIFKIRKSM